MIKVKEAKDAELSISSAQLRAHKKVSIAMCSGCLQHTLLVSVSLRYSIDAPMHRLENCLTGFTVTHNGCVV